MNFTERFNPPETLYSQSPSVVQQKNDQRVIHPNKRMTERGSQTLVDLFSGMSASEILELDQYEVGIPLWETSLLEPVRNFLKTPGKSLRRDFVELGWSIASAIKGQTEGRISSIAPDRGCPQELIHLIELLHSGSLIVDDIEDQSLTRRGQPCLHRQIGLAPALNIGNWLYFVSAHMIDRLDCDPITRSTIHAHLNRVMLRCHQGQAVDVSCKVTLYQRDEIPLLTKTSTRLKTGVLVGFAIQLGGLLLNIDQKHSRTLYDFGEKIGLALQMYDDLSGFLNDKKWHKGCEDIGRQRLTWVWSWLAERQEIDDHEFNNLMTEVEELALDNHPNQLVMNAEQWSAKALSLRDQCRPHLAVAEGEIKREIKSALHELASRLESDEAYEIAHLAVSRLQRSYL